MAGHVEYYVDSGSGSAIRIIANIRNRAAKRPVEAGVDGIVVRVRADSRIKQAEGLAVTSALA